MEDLPEVLALAQAAERADCGETEWMELDLREEWERWDLERDAWVVLADGRIGGYATFENRGEGRLSADGYVQPELTGRGIGGLLVDLTEQRAGEELARIATGTRVYLQNATDHANAAALRLFERRGYHAVRHFFRMVIDLPGPPPEPEWPSGLRGEQFDPADAEALHAAVQEAFADEWGFRPESFEEFRKRRLESARFDPGLWFVAKTGGEIVGGVICDWKRNDVGWIASVAVRPGWRRRGLGLALLHAAFGEFYRRGERRCGLGVDTQNTTRATRLYERAGMRVLWQADVFEKELRA